MGKETKRATFRPGAREAIDFALDNLEDFETHAFLSEWREGKDLQPWRDNITPSPLELVIDSEHNTG